MARKEFLKFCEALDFKLDPLSDRERDMCRLLAPVVRRYAKGFIKERYEHNEQAYAEFFEDVKAATGEIRELETGAHDTYSQLIKNWLKPEKNQATTLAAASYYYLHTIKNGKAFAREVDRDFIGENDFDRIFPHGVPGGYIDGNAEDDPKPKIHEQRVETARTKFSIHGNVQAKAFVGALVLIALASVGLFLYKNGPAQFSAAHQAGITPDLSSGTAKNLSNLHPKDRFFEVAQEMEKAGREAERIAALAQAADEGNPTAELELVFSDYRIGQGSAFEADFKEIAGRHNIIARAEQGDKEARYFYGLMLLHGLSIDKDVTEARSKLLAAANQGESRAAMTLSILILEDSEVSSKCTGFSYARRAEENGYAIAKWIVARYLEEYACPAEMGSKQQAIRNAIGRLTSVIASSGLAEAKNMLGVMYKDGIGFAKSDENDREAVELFMQARSQGLLDATINLGIMYAEKRGENTDERTDKIAVDYFREGVKIGNARAQHALGWMYMNGRVDDDKNADDEAVRLLKLAVSQGYVRANSDLAWMYRKGRGVEQNDEKAMRLYQEAAETGNTFAQVQLAHMYRANQGSEESDQNKKTAFDWYKRAAAKSAEAQYSLGKMYIYNQGVPDEEDIDAKALEWFQKSAAQDYPDAINALGVLYEHGRGVEKDLGDAFSYYAEASRLGNPTAKVNLGWIFAKDDLGKKDYDKALKLFREAEDAGEEGATAAIGWLYANGFGVDKDPDLAFRKFKEAADSGDSYAQFYLGQTYRFGFISREIDYEESAKWYRKAALQGDNRSLNSLGTLFETGKGVDQSDERAVHYYRQAAKQGNANAQYNLGQMYAKGRGVPAEIEDANSAALALFKESLPKIGMWELINLARLNTLEYKNQNFGALTRSVLDSYIDDAETEKLADLFQRSDWSYLHPSRNMIAETDYARSLCEDGLAVWCFGYSEAELVGRVKKMSQMGMWQANFGLLYYYSKQGNCVEANRFAKLSQSPPSRDSNRYKIQLAYLFYGYAINDSCNLEVDGRSLAEGVFEAAYDGNEDAYGLITEVPTEIVDLISDDYPVWIAKLGEKSLKDSVSDLWPIIGNVYMYGGPGIAPQPDSAELWFKKAINTDSVYARFQLARLYVTDFKPARASEAIEVLSANADPQTAIQNLETIIDELMVESSDSSAIPVLKNAKADIQRQMKLAN